MRDLLYCLLFGCVTFATQLYFTKEHLTLTELNKKVSVLDSDIKKIDTQLKTQEKRMGAASTQAAQAQALLHANKS
jgi:predicted  nucleic acid-binding Zn-ribbon protein